jgi:hypothetical protein
MYANCIFQAARALVLEASRFSLTETSCQPCHCADRIISSSPPNRVMLPLASGQVSNAATTLMPRLGTEIRPACSNLNEGSRGRTWTWFDLRNSLALGRSVAYIADFLCRSEDEVREKIAEMDTAKNADRN